LRPSAETLVSRLLSRIEGHSGGTIVRFLGEADDDIVCLDYAQIDRRARALGAKLHDAGAAGERVLILHVPGVDYITALLGCLYAGAIAVPAYPPGARAMARLRAIAQDAGARFALADEATIAAMAARSAERAQTSTLGPLTWLATAQAGELAPEDWQPMFARPEAVAVLQYTSGSTSAPKGVRLSHANFLDNIDALSRLRGSAVDDRLVSWLPPFHDMGLVFGILGPLCAGLETTLMAPASFMQRPLRWLTAISRYGGTVSGAPNFAYELCVRRIVDPQQRAELDLRSWRLAFCGAERVRAETMERFAAAFEVSGLRRAALTPCYGLAESTVAVAFARVDAPPRSVRFDERALGRGQVLAAVPEQPSQALVACGTPLHGCELRIVDPAERRLAAPDAVGEIWLRSPSVGDGYWNQPHLSEQAFGARRADAEPADASAGAPAAAKYLRTGDLGFMYEGELFVVGRIKDLIVLRGANIFPDDIEASAQAAHPQLRAGGCAAFSIDDGREERLVIVQELVSARDAPLREIADAIAGAVAQAHEIAADQVVLVPPGAVPRTSSGKIQRGLCREHYLAGQLRVLARGGVGAATDHGALPAADTAAAAGAEQVAGLMASLLGLPAVGADDDFFWLGGHSLMATQLVSRVRETFGVELPLRAVFEAPTPARLAQRIAAAPPLERLPPIVPVDRGGRLRLSFSQERMWLLHQLDPASAAYNVAGSVLIEGPLAPAALARALDAVVARHEVLRTNYLAVDGEPQVRIAARLEVPLVLTDVSDRPDPLAAAVAEASALAHAPFDIAKDPLLRAALYRVGAGQHLMAVCMHHLVTDAWSMGLFVNDMLLCYDAFAAGRDPVLPDAPIGYLDYAHWQREYLSGEHLSGQLAYWKRQLEGASSVELPADRPRAQRRSSDGAFLPLPLSDELIDALGALGSRHGATLFMVLLAAFEVLLHRHSGAGDLVVGVPVANRNRLASEALMGSLVNTLALRLHLDPDASFADLLARVREATLDAYAHQDLPFERLVSELPVERRPGESPIVSVMFDFQNAPVAGRTQGELRMRPHTLSRGAAQFDLSLLIFHTEMGRMASVEYRTDLFDAATVRRMLGHYLAILEAVVTDPGLAISRIPMLGAAERAELLALGSGRQVAAPAVAVTEAIAAQARSAPLAAALWDEAGSLSYAELDHASTALAARLHALGAGPGQRVAVCLERDRRLPLALLATWKTGAAYVPLDPRHPQERLAFMLEDSDPCVLVTDTALRERLTALLPPRPEAAAGGRALRWLCLDEQGAIANAPDLAPQLPPAAAPPYAALPAVFAAALPAASPAVLAAAPPATLPALPHDPARAAYLIYTSGSTGRPKGVEVSAGALSNFLRSMAHAPGIAPGDRMLAVTTISFDIAGLELWLPLVNGASVRLLPSTLAANGPALLARMREWRPTIMQATPASWRLLLESGWDGDPGLTVLCGGEALAPELAQALCARSRAVWNLYGPTETTIWSAIHRVRADEGPPVPIGVPIDNTRIYVLDRHGELQPRGVPGEIFIGGAGVANGYFRRPELTQQRFLADPFVGVGVAMGNGNGLGDAAAHGARMYRTGDGGRIRADGLFECLARLDDQIKLRGYRIEPGEIEAVIKDDPRIADALVVARTVRPGDVRLVAYFVASTSAPITEALRERLQRRLPSYMVPTAFVAIDAFPKTPNGKIDRARLPAPPLEARAPDETFLAPRDPLEQALVEIWESVLDTRPIGVRDSFFRLGGHSLLALRMIARIDKRIGVSLPLAAMIERPTVEYLAERIRAARPFDVPGDAQYLVPVQRKGTRVPLFCVHGAGGHVLNFSELARHLGDAQPFFAFQARGVDGRSQPFERVEQAAQAYLAELRRAQPHGPYHLGGYCGGGIIAFEMARMLEAEGERVGLLALLDCYRPGISTGVRRHQRWAAGLAREGLPYLARKTRVWLRRTATVLSVRLCIAVHRGLGRAVPLGLRDFWLTHAFLASARRYRPALFGGKLTLLRATEVDAELLGVGRELGWAGLAAQGIETIDVPGDHYSLLQEPNLPVLAARLEEAIAAAGDATLP
jgi:amino acid adenylation domain-containing protein